MLTPSNRMGHESLYHWIVVRAEPGGQFTAQVVGISEVRATAASRDEALRQVGTILAQWLATGQLTPLALPHEESLRNWPGHDPTDPLEQEFLADLETLRKEALDCLSRQGQADDASCSSTSSTPTT